MNKSHLISICIVAMLVISYSVDRNWFMKKRVLRHTIWEHSIGNRIRGDFIDTDNVIFIGDTMIFHYKMSANDTLILEHQYFSFMKVTDPKTNNSAKFVMKGANWTDYVFK